MKASPIIFLLLSPAFVCAGSYPEMNQEYLQQMQQMGLCMANIDQVRLKEIEQSASRFQAETKSLCESGRRTEAQSKAIKFGREMSKDPTMQELKRCGSMMQRMMPKIPFMDKSDDPSSHHVCG